MVDGRICKYIRCLILICSIHSNCCSCRIWTSWSCKIRCRMQLILLRCSSKLQRWILPLPPDFMVFYIVVPTRKLSYLPLWCYSGSMMYEWLHCGPPILRRWLQRFQPKIHCRKHTRRTGIGFGQQEKRKKKQSLAWVAGKGLEVHGRGRVR